MARVGLAITITVPDTCDGMTFADSTGAYDVTTNPLGYGLPGGTTSANVTGAVIVVTIADGTYFTYTFTILNNALVTATLGVGADTATNIYSEVSGVVFPFTAFDLFDGYGVTLPDAGDGVYNVNYTITGRIDPAEAATAYNYTTTSNTLISCALCCCLSKMALAIDPSCDCSNDAIISYLRAATYGKVAKFAMQVGQVTDATNAFNKAVALCDCGCADC